MDGDGAQGVEDNENNRHDAGVRISFPVEDFVAVVIPFLIDISRITLVMSLLTEDHLRCLIVGQTEVAPLLSGSTHQKPRPAPRPREYNVSSCLDSLVGF